MKTIKHKGKVYQVGGVYEFSNNGKAWFVDTLEAIHQGDVFPYKAQWCDYNSIRACEAKAGTVEDEPLKLKNGECYRYTGLYGNERKGFFSARHDMFFRTEGRDAPSECTNIKLLVVGE
jgi:hypothetical protein